MTLYEWIQTEIRPKLPPHLSAVAEAARRLKVSRGSVAGWLAGKCAPGEPKWKKLSRRTGGMVRPHGFSRRWVGCKDIDQQQEEQQS